MNSEISDLYRYLAAVSAKYFGKRLILTSGDRTCARQKEVSAELSSFHVVGEAFDAQLSPYNKQQQKALGQVAEKLGFRWGGRFKIYDDVHFDNGNRARPGNCR